MAGPKVCPFMRFLIPNLAYFIPTDYSALTLKYVHDYHGPCTIQVREECIVIKRSNGKEIGRWPYPFIREFRFDDEKSQFFVHFRKERRIWY